ncbi:hypothetical protein GCM10027073_60790 [Streptomyces chlorus]
MEKPGALRSRAHGMAPRAEKRTGGAGKVKSAGNYMSSGESQQNGPPLRGMRRGGPGTAAPDGNDTLGRLRYFSGAPTGSPFGRTAYHVPPTPWPLVSPAALSPAKV